MIDLLFKEGIPSFWGVKAEDCRNNAFPDWKKHKVEVDDGGFWFWRIEYDVDNGACQKFSSNGYA